MGYILGEISTLHIQVIPPGTEPWLLWLQSGQGKWDSGAAASAAAFNQKNLRLRFSLASSQAIYPLLEIHDGKNGA